MPVSYIIYGQSKSFYMNNNSLEKNTVCDGSAQRWRFIRSQFARKGGEVHSGHKGLHRPAAYSICREALAKPKGQRFPAHDSVPKNILDRVIGKLNHSRWLTLAARLIRLYVSMEANPNDPNDPFPAIKRMAMYCVKIYFPLHMSMKVS